MFDVWQVTLYGKVDDYYVYAEDSYGISPNTNASHGAWNVRLGGGLDLIFNVSYGNISPYTRNDDGTYLVDPSGDFYYDYYYVMYSYG